MVEKTSPSTALDEYAEPRGADGETLRDTALAEFGLDESGKKVYDLGGNTIIVALAQDLTLSIFNGNAGKAVNSIPKKRADPKENRYAALRSPTGSRGKRSAASPLISTTAPANWISPFSNVIWNTPPGAARRRYLDLNGAKLSVGQMRHWFFQAIFLS